jgi:hypothetical protein
VVLLTGGGGDGDGPLAYDFDGDGKQEAVIAPLSATSPEIVIHPGSEDGKPEAISSAVAGLPDADSDSAFGSGLASADFDGDGHLDLAVGAMGLNALAVLYGTADGIKDGEQIEGARAAAQSATSLAAADFNGDSYGDLVVGSIGAGGESGAVEILFGSAEGLRTTGSRTFPAPEGVEVDYGDRVAVGDINGDDHTDLVEGAPSANPTVPGAHLTYCPGSARGPTTCQVLPGRDGDSGTSGLAVADVNADGFDDIVQTDVSMPGAGGGVRIWLGSADGPETTPAILTPLKLRMHDPDAASPAADFGASVDAGRLDGDKYADIVVGAPSYRGDDGAIVIIRGGPSGYTNEPQLVRGPEGEGDRFGSSVALLHLRGGDPSIVVAAEDADLDAAVSVVDDGDARPLGGLAGVIDGSAKDNDHGRTTGS